jgi:hypothetical protein
MLRSVQATALLSIAAWCVCAGAAAGCKKAADCESAVKHVMTLDDDVNATPEVKKEVEDMMAAARALAVERCTKDKWSAEVLACMSEAKTSQDAEDCASKLTPEQQKALTVVATKVKEPAQVDGKAVDCKAAVDGMKGFRDEICACKDKVCAESVERRWATFERTTDPACTRALYKIRDEQSACLHAIPWK